MTKKREEHNPGFRLTMTEGKVTDWALPGRKPTRARSGGQFGPVPCPLEHGRLQ
jgi:hypothetical protein